MALDGMGQIPEVAEERVNSQSAQNPTTLDKLRSFVQKHKVILGVIAGVTTPTLAADCAREPASANRVEKENSIQMTLEIIQQSPIGMVGIRANIHLDEPLTDTHVELLDDQGNSLYAANQALAADGGDLTFVEEGYERGSAIAVPGGSRVRTVVVSGRNSEGQLVQNEALLNSDWLNDADPFPNE